MQEMQQVCMSGTYVLIGSCRLLLHTAQLLALSQRYSSLLRLHGQGCK